MHDKCTTKHARCTLMHDDSSECTLSPHFEPKKQGRQILANFIRVPPYRLGSKLATLVFRLKMCGQGALPPFQSAFANLSPFRRAFFVHLLHLPHPVAPNAANVANARKMHVETGSNWEKQIEMVVGHLVPTF